MDYSFLYYTLLVFLGLILFLFTQKMRKKNPIPWVRGIMVAFATHVVLIVVQNLWYNDDYIFRITYFCGILRDWFICLFFLSLTEKKWAKKTQILIYTFYTCAVILITVDILFLRVEQNLDAHNLVQILWQSFVSLSSAMVFGIIGIGIYVPVFLKMREKEALILGIGCLLGLIGWLTHFFSYILRFLDLDVLSRVRTIEEVLAITGLFLIILVYFFSMEYVYRLPNDYFSFLVKHRDGISLYSVDLENSKNLEIPEDLIAGFLTAVNSLFIETLHSKFHIDEIASGDAIIQMKSSNYFTAIVIGESAPKVLEIGLEHFVKDFEKKYADNLGESVFNNETFQETGELIKKHFPFFKVKSRAPVS